MSEFMSSALANFAGSFLAGIILSVLAYWFVTRRFEVIRPRRERIQEELMVCDLLIDELKEGQKFASNYLGPPPRGETRLQMHAWETLKGSQAIRFLPLDCLRATLKAYAQLYPLETIFLRVEDAFLTDVAAGKTDEKSNSARLGNFLSRSVIHRLQVTRQNCGDAILALTAERDRLKTSEKS